MRERILENKLWIVVVLILGFLVFYSSNAFAWGGSHSREHHEHYYYRSGHWHDSGWFWGLFATALVVGTVVATLPPHYETIYVSGSPYYYDEGIYYRQHPSGYVVVPTPATTTVVTTPAVMPPQVASGETVVINIPNSRGGYTPVTLVKRGDGYVGPQGEYYQGHPTVNQLRALYGN